VPLAYWLFGMLFEAMKKIIAAIGLCASLVSTTGEATRAPQFGPPPRDMASCKFAPAVAGHSFIVVGIVEGDTLTNLQIGDPNSESTVVRVAVDARTKPLTLYLYSQNRVIWDFEGAVERVERAVIVAANGALQSAVRGLPERAAAFPDLAGCPHVFLPPSQKPAKSDSNIEPYFGRAPDRILFQAYPNLLKLPEGEFVLTPREKRGIVIVNKDENGKNFSQVVDVDASGKLFLRPVDDSRTDAEQDLVSHHPGGFREIDGKSVVSHVPVLDPETHPAEAGLIQLEKSGAIRPPRRSDIDNFVDGVRRQYPSKDGLRVDVDYVVTRDIMLPPGLTHHTNFLVLGGVPAPRGNTTRHCVMFLDNYRADDRGTCPPVLTRRW